MKSLAPWIVLTVFPILAGDVSPGHANDSIAEMSIGGLQLARTDAIAMESERLKISLDAVDVHYRFSNVSSTAIKNKVRS